MSEARSDAEVAARTALEDYLRRNPAVHMRVMFDHFFPPSSLPFSREDLRRALVEGLYYGRIRWDDERRLIAEGSA